MSQRRILFVDDEQYILDGLQNILRKHRHEWQMVFACGGNAALGELAKAPFDVIVSDMQMPGMDGATLLRKVKDDYPGIARIALSGYADRDSVLRALGVVHQFLSKPCDGETLRIVIERTCRVQTLLRDATIREAVGRVDRLPSIPDSYWKLTRAVADPNVRSSDLALIVERDSSMAAKVLQLANSAYFSPTQPMSSVTKAVGVLGTDLLKGLALTAQVFSMMEAAPVEGFSLPRLQEHSLLTSRLAKAFVGDRPGAEETVTAALVHDIGKIVMALSFPAQFQTATRQARDTNRPFHLVEKELLGVTHAEVGAYLLGVWGLPFSIVEAVAFHHTPDAVTEGSCEILAALHVADELIDTREHAEPGEEGRLCLSFLERTGFAAKLPKWRALAMEYVQSA